METAMLLAVLLTLLPCVTGASAQEEMRAAFFNWTLDEYAHNEPGTQGGSWQTRMEKLRADGYNAVILMGHHFRWNIIDRWPETVEALARLAEVAHSLDMRIYEHHSAALCSEERIQQPVGDGKTVRDLLEIKADTGEPINYLYNAYWLCPNNPTFRAVYFDYVRAIFTGGRFDGFMCDDVEMLPDASVCACDFCARRFADLTGAALPESGDDSFWFNEDSGLWRRWVRARQTSVADFYRDVNALLQELVPGAPLFICQADPTGVLVTSKWALANDIFEPSVGIRFWEDWQGDKPDYRKVWRRAILNLTYLDNLSGRRKPVLDLFYTGTEEQTQLRWACDRVTGAWSSTVEHCPRSEYMGQFLQPPPGPPVANVAIVHSAAGRDYRTGSGHVQSFWAWGEALVDSGAGFAVLTEDQLTDVAKLTSYRLIILPEVVCLSEQALTTLNQAALAGVRVVYTPGSGAFDETGAPADRTALATTPQAASLYRRIAPAPESRRAMRELFRWAGVRSPAQVRGANSGYCRLYDAGDGRYQLRIMQYNRTPNRNWRIVLPGLSITAARLRSLSKVELDLAVHGGSARVPEGTVTGYCQVDLICSSQ